MDATGLVFAVAGVAKTWVDLFNLILTASQISNDLDGFITHVRNERVIFWLWCHRTGMQDAANKIQSGATPNTVPDRAPLDIGKLLPSGPVQDTLLPIIGDNMKLMDRTLGEIQTFLTSYGAGASQTRNCLQKPLRGRDQSYIADLVERDKWKLKARQAAVRDAAAGGARTRKDSVWDAARWAASGKAESTRLVNELKSCNDALGRFVDLLDPDPDAPQRFQRAVQMSIASTSLGTSISQLSSGIDPNQPLVQICQMAERQKEIGLLETIEKGQTTPAALHGVPPTPPQGLLLKRNDFSLPHHEGGVPPERQRGTYKNGQAVLVEWRYYSKRLSPEGRELLQYKISGLVLQLQQSSFVSGFMTPRCLGFFHSAPEGRYGIAFEIPPGARPDGPKSLQRYLLEDNESKTFSRELPARLRLARQLALAMFQFFSVRWIHKNVRSSSVLFFDTEPDPHSLPDAKLLGFGFARMEDQTAQTEINPSTLRDNQQRKEWRLYCHPDRDRALMQQQGAAVSNPQQSPATAATSTMYHDAYGLGIVLLEIALWAPVIKLCGTKSVEEFQQKVATKYMHLLQFNVGDRYAQVVRRLLVGDFGLDPAAVGDDDEDGDEDFDVKRVMFLEAFERTIVTELERVLRS